MAHPDLDFPNKIIPFVGPIPQNREVLVVNRKNNPNQQNKSNTDSQLQDVMDFCGTIVPCKNISNSSISLSHLSDDELWETLLKLKAK